ncbi:MAG: hypothetical protein ACFFDT_06770 [Candidatus Hodarchaeota archaeon]
MVFIWNFISVFVGLLFGIGFGIGLFLIADKLILEIRDDDPNNEFINSDGFKYVMKLMMPIGIVIGSSILIGPLFAWGYEYLQNFEAIIGLDPRIFFVIAILAFSFLLDLAVFVTKTPFPIFKLATNTWMFLTLGLLLHLLS